MYQYSMTQWIAGNEAIEESFKRLGRFGYDGIEFAAEPETTDVGYLRELMSQYDLTCTSLCGIFPESRDLSGSGQEGVSYVRAGIDMAAALGAPYLIVVPSPVGRTAPPPGSDYKESWDRAVRNVRTAADYAGAKNVKLAVEALNRYETYLVNSMEKNLAFVREVSHPAVKLMADCFHMSIEERTISESLRMVSDYLVHVHIADNTREAAGLGHTDFKEILYTLGEIGYDGALTMEFLPQTADPYAAADEETRSKQMDDYAELSIRYMKTLERCLKIT